MAYIRRFWVKAAPSFRKRYRQKEVYLNMAYLRRFWVKEPRHSETISDEECCYLCRIMRRNTVYKATRLIKVSCLYKATRPI